MGGKGSGYHRDEDGNLVTNRPPSNPHPSVPTSLKYARDPNTHPFEPDIELNTIEELAKMNCSDVEIAHGLNFNLSTFLEVKEAFPEIQHTIDRSKSQLKVTIWQAGVKKVLDGDTQMTVFMHKALLGYSDTLAAQVINAKNVAIWDTSPETLEHLKRLREHIYGLKPSESEALDLPNGDSEPN